MNAMETFLRNMQEAANTKQLNLTPEERLERLGEDLGRLMAIYGELVGKYMNSPDPSHKLVVGAFLDASTLTTAALHGTINEYQVKGDSISEYDSSIER